MKGYDGVGGGELTLNHMKGYDGVGGGELTLNHMKGYGVQEGSYLYIGSYRTVQALFKQGLVEIACRTVQARLSGVVRCSARTDHCSVEVVCSELNHLIGAPCGWR
jgi:hypothetical protein